MLHSHFWEKRNLGHVNQVEKGRLVNVDGVLHCPVNYFAESVSFFKWQILQFALTDIEAVGSLTEK